MRIDDLVHADADECGEAFNQVRRESSGTFEMLEAMGTGCVLALNLDGLLLDCIEANPDPRGGMATALLMAFVIGATYAERMAARKAGAS